MKRSPKKITLSQYTLFHSLQDVFPLLPPSSAGTCDNHRGRRAVSLRMSLEKHVGDNDGARERGGGRGGRKEKKKTVPEGLWGPAKQLNGCKQHHGPHVQTFKISARVMGSAWPLSGCTKHQCSFPSEVLQEWMACPAPVLLQSSCILMSSSLPTHSCSSSIAFVDISVCCVSASGLNLKPTQC